MITEFSQKLMINSGLTGDKIVQPFKKIFKGNTEKKEQPGCRKEL
jgi:hypothetical protein